MKVRFRHLILAVWAITALTVGAALTSYHQAFTAPGEGILMLAKPLGKPGWLAVHVLSSSCGCSQRVMMHLLNRHVLSGLNEQVVIIDDETPRLERSDELIEKLAKDGFSVSRINAKDISTKAGLLGVPLLVFASPEQKVEYVGGYGSTGEKDADIYSELRSGQSPLRLPVLGCAVGHALKQKVDPFHLKY